MQIIFEIIVWLAIVTNTIVQLRWYLEDKKNNRTNNLLAEISNQLLESNDLLLKTSFNTLNTSKNTYYKKRDIGND